MQRALENAFAELILGAPLDPNDAGALASFFARHGVAPEDAAAVREEIGRLLVYRKLVQGTLRDAIELAIPRSVARLGPLFDEYFARFLAERGPRTHYLRDVTTELLDFCAKLWPADARAPAYLMELARLEALRIEIAAAPPRKEPEALSELALDAGLSFSEAQRLLHFEYRVHELSESLDDRSPPAPGPTELLVYRSPDHMVRYLELTPLAAAIVARLRAGESLKDSLITATRAAQAELDDATLSGAATLLADLSARGVVLGPCPARAANQA